MDVAIISCFVSNEMRINSVTAFLKKGGHAVTVIESDFVHLNKTYRNNPPENHIYLHAQAYKKNISVNRLLSHAKFSRAVISELEKHEFDLLYVLVPPNSLIKEIIAYKNQKNVKVIFDVIDLWPESLPINISSDFWPLRKWKNIRNQHINAADYVITQCDLYKNHFNIDVEKSSTVYFCKSDVSVNLKRSRSSNEIVLAYLGSINYLIDIPQIKSMVRTLTGKYRVVVHVVGAGHKLELFLRELGKSGAEVVYHGELYDPNRLAELFSECDFGINIYKTITCIGMTLKSIDYFCCGLPILNNISGDTERLVEQYHAGINMKNFSLDAVEKYRRSGHRIADLVATELSEENFEKKMQQILCCLEKKK